MKKTQYITPALKVAEIELTHHLLGASDITGNGTIGFGGAGDGKDDEEADVKRGYNVWSDDWSR